MAQTRVASQATDTQLLAADIDRRVVTIENSDLNRLYVRIGGSAAATDNYSFSLAQYDIILIPRELCGEEIRGIWGADGAGYAIIESALSQWEPETVYADTWSAVSGAALTWSPAVPAAVSWS